nr:MauE/DoxX family redox-associated membrane protein [Microbacterium sp. No. 7]
MATVFLISGLLKLLSPSSTRAGLSALRLPSPFSQPWFAVAWPATEIVLAIALIVCPSPLHLLALAAAAAANIAFLVVIVRASRFAEEIHCHCFGAIDSAPVSAATVLRNASLVVLSAVALLGAPRGSFLGAVSHLGADAALFQLGLFLWAGLAVAVALQSLTPRAPHAPRAAAEASAAELSRHLLRDIFGTEHDVRRFVDAEQSVLFFVSTTCAACRGLTPQIAEWIPQLSARGVRVRLVLDSPPEEAISAFPAFGALLLHDREGRLARELGLSTVPSAVHLGRDGVAGVSTGPAAGSIAIETLVENVLFDATTVPR